MTPEERLRAWGAEPTGPPWSTPSSVLAPGVRAGVPVMLKVARVEEERRGGRLLAAWAGRGAVPVLEHDDDALLLLRATGPRDLADWATSGRDDDATDVLVDAVAALHALPAPPASVGLVPLATWFRDLVDRPQEDPLLDAAAAVARDLLRDGGPPVALHGDVHHGNVLDLGDRWAAIDPKGLVGPRPFDLANLFCNPSAAVAVPRLDVRLVRVAARAGLPEEELAAWVVAWCGLSITWSDGPSDDRDTRRAVAAALLPRIG